MYISDIPPAVEEVYSHKPLNTSRWYITDIHRVAMVHISYIMLNFDEVYILLPFPKQHGIWSYNLSCFSPFLSLCRACSPLHAPQRSCNQFGRNSHGILRRASTRCTWSKPGGTFSLAFIDRESVRSFVNSSISSLILEVYL